MFRNADLGQIILAKTFYDVLYTAQVPDGEGAPGWTIRGVKESSDKHSRKVNVSLTVYLQDKLLPSKLKTGYMYIFIVSFKCTE